MSNFKEILFFLLVDLYLNLSSIINKRIYLTHFISHSGQYTYTSYVHSA